jgi:hypothetical protein
LYANALTLIKDEEKLLPLSCDKVYYYVPLEEADYQPFLEKINTKTTMIKIDKAKISEIPVGETVLIGLHKDNSTAYKPYKISAESRKIIENLAQNHKIILDLFGSPYALKDLNISNLSTVLIAYENNEFSMEANAKSLAGEQEICGMLPVDISENLKFGAGMILKPADSQKVKGKIIIE